MRAVLSLSLLLLVLTLLLNAEHGERDSARSRRESALTDVSRGSTVRVFSSGATLIPERFERCIRAQEILVDGKLYKFTTEQNGLRVASFFPGEGEVVHDNYDLAKSDEAVEAFAERVHGAPVDTVMAMGVFRLISPRGPGAAERQTVLDELFHELGPTCEPQKLPRPSWAYVCIRRPGGWVPIAERMSETKGIMLSVNVSADPTVYDRLPRPHPVIETWRSRRLVETFGWGLTQIDPYTAVRRGYGVSFEVDFDMRDGIMTSPPFGPEGTDRSGHAWGHEPGENRLAFDFVRLEDAPRFEVLLGIESYHRKTCRGVEFEVLVDGTSVGVRRIAVDPDEPDAWIPWTVDLAGFENRWVRLELRTRSLGLLPAEVGQWQEPAIWADPTLIDTPNDPPKGAGTRDAVLDTLDRNRDGFLPSAEFRVQILALLDADQDGRVTTAEEPVEFPGLAAAMDANGDGGADAGEIEGFYSELRAWLER